MQIIGRRYDTLEAVTVTVLDGVVCSVESEGVASGGELPWIAPGFVDLQVNGYAGVEFNNPELTTDDVQTVCGALVETGVTRFLPTVTTAGFDLLQHALKTLRKASKKEPLIAGIHLEGPYISAEDGPRGAHPREHVRPPCWDEFQKLQQAAGGLIRLLTLSPEYDEAPGFIRQAVDAGVVVAIGHTAASSGQIAAAVDAGASMSTHLGNGAHGQIRRHPNYIWDQLADDRLTASLIADGHHLPAAVLKTFVRAKSPAGCVLVSDVTGMAGMPPGEYNTLGLGAVEVLESGKLVVAGQRQYLAGAALPIGVGVSNMMRMTGVDITTAVDMASTSPAKIAGLQCGGFTPGDPAHFVLFDLPSGGALTVRQTVL